MFVKHKYLFFIVIGLLVFKACAKKGRPSGGPIDEEAPLFVIANPPYQTTNFSESEIKIEFNEYIVLKDLNKQLVVSPPLKNNPVISPQGSASKNITIKLLDTLLENTTYIFDFGKSVQDNNEGNELGKFKYVFSTGNLIDSLYVKGSVKDAYNEEASKNIKLLLFRADSTYQDSLIYKQKPNYVSSTLDTTLFEFSNLAAGKFYLFALEDKSSDYYFNPKEDKIGVYPKVISIPEDSILIDPIKLFKENLPYQFKRAKEDVKGKLTIGFQGKPTNLFVKPLSVVSDSFLSVSKFEKEKDTLNYWFYNYDKDSIVLLIQNEKKLDTATVRLRKKKLDSLTISKDIGSYLEFNDTLLFSTNNPVIILDTSKVKIFDKDTTLIKVKNYISKKENKFGFLFNKQFANKYKAEILPGAVKDLFGFTNDTIQFNFATRKQEDYSDITLNIQNPKNKPLIVQLITLQGKLVEEKKTHTSGNIVFKYLKAKKLKARVIHDANNNGFWDTGNFLQKEKPENIFYYPTVFEPRPNWSLNETITINDDF